MVKFWVWIFLKFAKNWKIFFEILLEFWLFLVFFKITKRKNAEEGVRTLVGTKPIGPKPIPFDHSGTSASETSGDQQSLSLRCLRTGQKERIFFGIKTFLFNIRYLLF